MRRILHICLMIFLCGALLLVATPSLHASQHDRERTQHHSQQDCQICHILANYVFEPLESSLASIPTIELQEIDAPYQKLCLIDYHGPFSSRAPPTI